MAVGMRRFAGATAVPLPLHCPSSASPWRLSPSNSPRRFTTLAAVKRSPKRLKYSTPRFTKEDGLLYVEVDPSGSDSWRLDSVVNLLKQGAVGVIPTDTVYAIVCDLRNNSAIERLRRIKDIEPSKPLSILCHSFKDIDTYTTGFPRGNDHGLVNFFRAVKHCLPGPAILEKMEAPLISTSVKSPKEDEWILDPVVVADIYGPEGLDFVVGAGTRVAYPSTVVDMTGASPRIIRQGKGPKQAWMVAEDEDDAINAMTGGSLPHPAA